MTVNLKEFWKMNAAQEGRSWFRMEEVAHNTHVVEIFGVIGDWEVDPIDLVNQLKAVDGDGVTIELRIDSPGGSVPGGVLIMSCLASLRARTVAKIWGQAFSMASLIPIACDEVWIAKDAYMMIHEPRGLGYGTAAEVMAAAKYLEKIREQAADRYAERTVPAGHSREEVLEAMRATTYLTSLESIEWGLADGLIETVGKSTMKIDPEFAAVMLGDEVPDEVRARFASDEEEASETDDEGADEAPVDEPTSEGAEEPESEPAAEEEVDETPEDEPAPEPAPEDPLVSEMRGDTTGPVSVAHEQTDHKPRKSAPASWTTRIAEMNAKFGRLT